jgi:hypothetical protein
MYTTLPAEMRKGRIRLIEKTAIPEVAVPPAIERFHML